MYCKDCVKHDICAKWEKLMLTVDNNNELIYQYGVDKSCKEFEVKKEGAE